MISGIYQIRNILNGKRYVGSSAHMERRRQEHFSTLRNGSHKNSHLQSAFNKYGETAFVFEVLEETEEKRCVPREQHYIDTLHPEYNQSPTAGRVLGYRYTPEQSRRHSEAQRACKKPAVGAALRGRPLSLAHRRNIALAQRGRKQPGISAALTGRSLSAQHRRNISKALKGHPVGDETRRKLSVVQRGKAYEEVYGPERAAEERRKRSEALKGRPKSVAHRQAISEGRKRYRAEQAIKT